MIRAKKDFKRYATRVDVTNGLLKVKGIEKFLKKESIKSLKLPKNTLKIIFQKMVTGYDGDGFARDVKTVIFHYKIITFKR